jgi:hypothetical protein
LTTTCGFSGPAFSFVPQRRQAERLVNPIVFRFFTHALFPIDRYLISIDESDFSNVMAKCTQPLTIVVNVFVSQVDYARLV